MDLDKPLEEYNKTEIKKLITLLKSNISGRVAYGKGQEKVDQLRQNIANFENSHNLSSQLVNNISIVEQQMNNTILQEHSFGTAILVDNVWNALHGKVIYNKMDNIIDKYARH